MSKKKKLTYNELANFIVNLDNKLSHAISVVGASLTDYVEMKGDKEDFMKHLKKKYKEKNDEMSKMREEESKTKEEKV
tara:strand:- start:6867 stop:7100 length:234 start_codon:yes stop_codon:yes gene_type:complete